MAVTCMLPSATCHHRLRTSPSAAWCPQVIPVTRTSPSLAHHHRPHGAPKQCLSPAHHHCLRITVRVAISCMVPLSDARHLRVAIDCVSPSLACHCRPHGAPKQCLSPAHRHCLRVTVRVAVGCMVPPSDACHPRIAVDRTSPSLARHHRPHGVPEQCPSPAHRHCLRVTVRVAVSRTVPTSNACHPHVAIACASPFASPSAVLLRSWALPPIFRHFLPFYSMLSVTRSPLVPSCAARTVTKSPEESPDRSPDHSAVNYHMPSLRSPQHPATSPFNPF